MDLFTIAATFWKHRIATIPVIVITLIAGFYILEIKPPTYQSTAEILLVTPPAPPTTAQIAADPALKKVNTNNPFLNYGSLVLVADVVIDVAGSPSAAAKLTAAGAGNYTVALANAFQSPPIIQVTGNGSNPETAFNTAGLASKEVISALQAIQVKQGVNSQYMITGEQFVAPTPATASSSSKLRTLIGLLAVGLILMLIAVSIAQTLEKRKLDRKSRAGNSAGVRDRGPYESEDDPNGKDQQRYEGGDDLNRRGQQRYEGGDDLDRRGQQRYEGGDDAKRRGRQRPTPPPTTQEEWTQRSFDNRADARSGETTADSGGRSRRWPS